MCLILISYYLLHTCTHSCAHTHNLSFNEFKVMYIVSFIIQSLQQHHQGLEYLMNSMFDWEFEPGFSCHSPAFQHYIISVDICPLITEVVFFVSSQDFFGHAILIPCMILYNQYYSVLFLYSASSLIKIIFILYFHRGQAHFLLGHVLTLKPKISCIFPRIVFPIN